MRRACNNGAGLIAAAACALLVGMPPAAPTPARDPGRTVISQAAPPPPGEASREDGAARVTLDLRAAVQGLSPCLPACAARVPAWGRALAAAARTPHTSRVPRHLLFCTWLV